MRSWLAGSFLVVLGLGGLASIEAGASDRRARLAPDTGFETGDTGDTGTDTGADTGDATDTADTADSAEEGTTVGVPETTDTDTDGPEGPRGPRSSAAQEAGEEGGFGCSSLPSAGSLAALWIGVLLLVRRRRIVALAD